MYYHPFPYSNQLQNHHLYYKHNTLANPLSYHSNAYQSYDYQRNPIIYYNPYPYQNGSYHYRPDTIKVEVYLAGILCEQAGSGELNDLEIYGTIMANDTLLWNVDSKHHVKILEGNLYPIQVTKQMILESDQPLRVHGHLWEWDGGTVLDPNDDMGTKEMHFIDFSPEGERHTLRFQSKDQIVSVIFYVRSVS